MSVPARYTEKLAKAWAITRLILSTDKDTHFTGAIAQNAIEQENVEGLVSDSVTVTKVAIQSKQQLDYDLFFFRSSFFDNTDLDQDTFCGYVSLDLPTYGVQIAGVNQYYLDVSAQSLDYYDSDLTKTLHLALCNRSGTSKIAGTDGEVKITVTYQPRFTS